MHMPITESITSSSLFKPNSAPAEFEIFCYQALTNFCSLHSHYTTNIFPTVSHRQSQTTTERKVERLPPRKDKRTIPYSGLVTRTLRTDIYMLVYLASPMF